MISWMKIAQKDQYFFWIVFLAIVFFASTSWFYIGSEGKFTSPDETANYFFSSQFVTTSQLSYSYTDEEMQLGEFLPFPRSTKLAGDELISGSFIGLPLLYGAIGKIFGSSVIIYLTPLFASITVVFFYLFIKLFFDRITAFISTVLLFAVTPFWYYAARGMFHNMLFLSLLIIGLYFLVVLFMGNTKNKVGYSVVSGLLLGYALVVRSSEVVWVSLVIAAALIILARKKQWNVLIIFSSCFIAAFIPMFIYNIHYFGSPLSFGYTADSVQTIVDNQVNSRTSITQIFLPFGLEWREIRSNIYSYVFLVFPWFSSVLLIGVVLFLKQLAVRVWNKLFHVRSDDVPQISQAYTTLYFGMSLLLAMYYGSYVIQEYIDPERIIIGSSYLRYWLPIFVFGTPIVAKTIYMLANLITKKNFVRPLIVFFTIAIIMLSITQVFTDELQGLIQLQNNNKEARTNLDSITTHIPVNSIIITNEFDKVFFPEYFVYSTLPHENDKLRLLVDTVTEFRSLYFYWSPLNTSMDYLFDQLPALGYEVELVQSFSGNDEKLFQIKRN